MNREDGANQIRSMNREQEDGQWEIQRGGAEVKKVNKANNRTHGKTGRHNLSQEKEAVGEQKRLKQRLIVDDLISAGYRVGDNLLRFCHSDTKYNVGQFHSFCHSTYSLELVT